MSDAIVTHALAKRFGATAALDSLDWTVPRGSITALVGPNGAGKTTTVKLLLALTRASAGGATVLGLDPWRETTDLRRRVGFVPEDRTGFDARRVGELARAVAPLFPTWDHARFAAHLATARVDARTRMGALSKGQRSVVFLALAMAHAPELLLLDEPTDGLDPVAQDDLLRALLAAAAEGATVVVVTHRLADIEGVADRIALIDRGRLLLDGDIDELRTRWRVVRARLSDPLDAVSALPGVRRARRVGELTTIVSDQPDALLASLASRGEQPVAVDTMNLRELYLATTRGEAP